MHAQMAGDDSAVLPRSLPQMSQEHFLVGSQEGLSGAREFMLSGSGIRILGVRSRVFRSQRPASSACSG